MNSSESPLLHLHINSFPLHLLQLDANDLELAADGAATKGLDQLGERRPQPAT